jgi:hypothetical protein
MDQRTATHYLQDLGQLVAERALSAKRKAEVDAEDHFAAGVAFGYYEVVSLMQQQAEAFGLDLADFKLADLNPDRDLL